MNDTDELIDTILNERSLSRMIEQGNLHDSGCISAFREEYGDIIHDKNTNKKRLKNISQTNRKRNAELRNKLLELGYSITKQMGAYMETDYPIREESILVVDINDTGNLRNDLIELGTYYGQDSILFKPAGEEPYFIKTKGPRHGMKSNSAKGTGYKKRGAFGWSTLAHADYTHNIEDDDFFNHKLDYEKRS